TVADDLIALDLPLWDGRVDGVATYGDHPIKVHPSAVLRPGVVLGAEAGPIAIDARANIGATAVLEGPCYIGAGSQVGPGAHIRSATAIGPTCRIGGEVSDSIFQS